MGWKDRCLAFVKKYGKAARVVAGCVLNVVAPGSGALVEMVGLACDKANDIAQDNWEESLLEATQANTAELQRLGQLFEMLNTGLATLCDRAAANTHRPDALPQILRDALAADPTLGEMREHVLILVSEFAAVHKKLDNIEGLLKNFKPGVSYDSEEERAYLREKRGEFRRLPRDRQKAGDWSALADRLGEAGEFELAREEHENAAQAAQQEGNAALAAAEHFKAYRAACEREQWTAALTSLRRAVDLQPQQAPFDWEQYEALEILGAGGFGTVFKCLDRNVHQHVAIKAIHTSDLARGIQDVFREAVLLTSLKHPTIIGVQTGRFADTARQRPYIIMEFFPSESLRVRLKRGPLSVADVLTVVRPLAEALRAAHGARPQPIYHRDVKPDNVLVDAQGRVKVIDFGLAVRVGAAVKSTSTDPQRRTRRDQSYAGTLRYAPPEQKGDVYSFGRTCCELLFGIPDLNEHPTKPKRHHHNRTEDPVPADLVALLKACLQPIPDDRPQDFGEVIEVLDRLQARKAPGPQHGETLRVEEQRQRGEKLLAQQEAAARRAAEEAERQRLAEEQRQRAEQERAAAQRQPLDCTTSAGVSAVDVRQSQVVWAKWLNLEVEETIDIGNGVTMTFVLVPPGNFLMGSPVDEAERRDIEVLHEVTLTKPFYLGKYPVTQKQFEALTGNNPSSFKGSLFPVETVSWEEAQDYAGKLTKKRADGQLYRLPTETEWEYASRGGRDSSQAFGVGEGRTLSSREANFNGNYPYGGAEKGPYLQSTCPVGSYSANALGLCDMQGNVWQWCADWYGDYPTGRVTDPAGPPQGSDRVIRGGSWYDYARSCRSALRYRSTPSYRNSFLGFRLARSVPSDSR
jgi:formylglycine-generating enzyme required for sulfatase activity